MDCEFVIGDPDKDFFEQNPQIKLFPFCEAIMNRHEKAASNVMWSLYVVEDPKSKIYYAMPYSERIELVEKKYNVNYLGDCMPYTHQYINACMNPHERNYKLIYDELQTMLFSLKTQEFFQKQEFITKLPGIYKALDLAEAKYKQESAEVIQKARGGKVSGGLFNKQNKAS